MDELSDADFSAVYLDEFEWDLHNLKNWIEDARAAYLAMVAPVHRIKVLNAYERIKHWPPAGWTRAQVVSRSGSKETGSYFYADFDGRILWSLLQAIIAERFDEFLCRSRRFFYVQWTEPVGGSRGMATDVICFDVEYSTPSSHAYPVTQEEIDDQASFVGAMKVLDIPYPGPPKW